MTARKQSYRVEVLERPYSFAFTKGTCKVLNVKPKSPAANSGLIPFSTITCIDGFKAVPYKKGTGGWLRVFKKADCPFDIILDPPEIEFYIAEAKLVVREDNLANGCEVGRVKEGAFVQVVQKFNRRARIVSPKLGWISIKSKSGRTLCREYHGWVCPHCDFDNDEERGLRNNPVCEECRERKPDKFWFQPPDDLVYNGESDEEELGDEGDEEESEDEVEIPPRLDVVENGSVGDVDELMHEEATEDSGAVTPAVDPAGDEDDDESGRRRGDSHANVEVSPEEVQSYRDSITDADVQAIAAEAKKEKAKKRGNSKTAFKKRHPNLSTNAPKRKKVIPLSSNRKVAAARSPTRTGKTPKTPKFKKGTNKKEKKGKSTKIKVDKPSSEPHTSRPSISKKDSKDRLRPSTTKQGVKRLGSKIEERASKKMGRNRSQEPKERVAPRLGQALSKQTSMMAAQKTIRGQNRLSFAKTMRALPSGFGAKHAKPTAAEIFTSRIALPNNWSSVPSGCFTDCWYKAKRSDTLASFAHKIGQSLAALTDANLLRYPLFGEIEPERKLKAGLCIRIPTYRGRKTKSTDPEADRQFSSPRENDRDHSPTSMNTKLRARKQGGAVGRKTMREESHSDSGTEPEKRQPDADAHSNGHSTDYDYDDEDGMEDLARQLSNTDRKQLQDMLQNDMGGGILINLAKAMDQNEQEHKAKESRHSSGDDLDAMLDGPDVGFFVDNIPKTLSESDVRGYFEEFGDLHMCDFEKDGPYKSATIAYTNNEDHQDVVRHEDEQGHEIGDIKLQIQEINLSDEEEEEAD